MRRVKIKNKKIKIRDVQREERCENKLKIKLNGELVEHHISELINATLVMIMLVSVLCCTIPCCIGIPINLSPLDTNS